MIDVAIVLKPGTNLEAAKTALEQAGMMEVQPPLEALRTITGKAEPQAIPQLRSVAGVDSVSELPPAEIAAPDSSIQ